MGKIYAGQTDLTIKLETGKNLQGITDVKIAFEKPNGTRGEFPAVVIEPVNGIIQFAVTNITDINIVGMWLFWAKVVNNQGLISIGEAVEYRIFAVGT